MPVRTTPIRWGRIVIAAVLSEVGVIAVLFAAIAAYTMLVPAMTDAEYSSLGEEVGYYVAPAAGGIMTVLSVLWVARTLTSDFIAHGLLVGLLSVLLTVGFIFTARPDHRFMYMMAFGLRIVAGYAGGVVAQWMFNSKAAGRSPIEPVHM
jgi:hypothetical protein